MTPRRSFAQGKSGQKKHRLARRSEQCKGGRSAHESGKEGKQPKEIGRKEKGLFPEPREDPRTPSSEKRRALPPWRVGETSKAREGKDSTRENG